MSEQITFKKKRRPGHAKVKDDATDDTASEAVADAPESKEDPLAIAALLKYVKNSQKVGTPITKLNRGNKKRKPQGEDTVTTEGGMVEGTSGGLLNNILKNNSFTGQTNTVDVDKHMMAFIEDELKKRNITTAQDLMEEADETDKGELYDRLYTEMAEKYRVHLQSEEERKKEGTIADDDDEGDIGLSATMLTAIPEVDLGIETKIRNIEETEKAKRELLEKRKRARFHNYNDDQGSIPRFYNARQKFKQLELSAADTGDSLARARRGENVEKPRRPKSSEASTGKNKLETAKSSDDIAFQKFRKYQQMRY